MISSCATLFCSQINIFEHTDIYKLQVSLFFIISVHLSEHSTLSLCRSLNKSNLMLFSRDVRTQTELGTKKTKRIYWKAWEKPVTQPHSHRTYTFNALLMNFTIGFLRPLWIASFHLSFLVPTNAYILYTVLFFRKIIDSSEERLFAANNSFRLLATINRNFVAYNRSA